MYWHRDLDQWDRIECLEINQYIYGDLNVDNGPKTIVKKAVFSKNSTTKIAD